MAKQSSRIDDRNTNYDAVVKQKRIFFAFVIIVVIVISISTVDILLNGEGNYSDYLWFNPFSSTKKNVYYYSNYYYVPIIMFTISLTMWIFHFGNKDKKYLKKLESIKQSILKIIPFYFDGYDERNLYIRFGLINSLENNFLKRKINKKDYLKKVSLLNYFTNKLSPHNFFIFNTSNKKKINLRIESLFLNEMYFLDFFKIIEGYLGENIELVKNVKINEYCAIGTNIALYSDESLFYFTHHNTSAEKENILNKNFKELIKKRKDKKISKDEFNSEIKETIINLAGKRQFKAYEKSVYKMVVFSPLAIKELCELVYIDSKRYFKQIKFFRSRVYEKIMEFGEIDENKIFKYISIVYFYKAINLYMGLPSAILTARLKDYDLQRIIDDLDHFENSKSIRQIKKNENDSHGKYNDTFARSFMIFYHEYSNNSIKFSKINKYFENMNPLRTVDYGDVFDFNMDSMKKMGEE